MHKQLQSEINKLMQKDMDRRDFLKHVGIGFAGILGITGALKTLGSLNGSQNKTANSGYGSNAYGGQKRTS